MTSMRIAGSSDAAGVIGDIATAPVETAGGPGLTNSIRGYHAHVYFDATSVAKARELCEQMGDTPELFPTLYGLWVFYYVRAEHPRAQELADQLLRLAMNGNDTGLLLEAHFALGNTLLRRGEFAAAYTHVKCGNALYDTTQHHTLAFSYGSYDPGVGCLDYTAMAQWLLGYPDQAVNTSDQALALAHRLAHPFSQVFALLFAATVRHF